MCNLNLQVFKWFFSIFKLEKIDDKEITEPEQIKNKNVSIEERIKNLEKRDIIIEKALLGIIERL